MNIFILDKNPKKCAKLLWYSSPLRANKQILELAQIMSVALKQGFGINDNNLYKLTHQKHPICKWAEKPENFTWCYELFKELNDIFIKKSLSKKEHLSFKKLEPIFKKYKWVWYSQKPIANWQNSSLFQNEDNITKAYNKTILEKIKNDFNEKLISKNQFNEQKEYLTI